MPVEEAIRIELPSLDGAPFVGDLEGARSEIVRRATVLGGRKRDMRRARLELGLALREHKKHVPYGRWHAELERMGIHRKTADRAEQDAELHLNPPPAGGPVGTPSPKISGGRSEVSRAEFVAAFPFRELTGTIASRWYDLQRKHGGRTPPPEACAVFLEQNGVEVPEEGTEAQRHEGTRPCSPGREAQDNAAPQDRGTPIPVPAVIDEAQLTFGWIDQADAKHAEARAAAPTLDGPRLHAMELEFRRHTHEVGRILHPDRSLPNAPPLKRPAGSPTTGVTASL